MSFFTPPLAESDTMTASIVLAPGTGWTGQAHHTLAVDPAPAPTIEAGWQLEDGTLRVYADRLGIAPLYLGVDGGTIAVSDSAVEAARAVSSPPDADAIALFLQIGFLVEEDTLYARVRALKPGERLTIRPDGIVETNGGALADPVPCGTLTRAQVVDQYIDLTTSAIKARLPDTDQRYGIPLSGGRDSRHLLLGSHAAGRAPDFVATHYAMPPQRDEDMRVAAELASALGLEHRKSAIDFSSFLSDAARKNVALDYHTDEHHWYLPLAESLAPQLDALMDGLGGDSLINNVFKRPDLVENLRAGRYEAAAAAIIGPPKIHGWLTPSLRELFGHDRALARLAEALRPLADHPDPAKEIQFGYKIRREIALAPLKIYPGKIGKILLPFIDPQIVDFSRSLTWEEHGATGIHDEVIHKAYPDFAHIEFERKGAGGQFSKAESRLVLSEYRRIRREWGHSDALDRRFISTRMLRNRLSPNLSGHFWWMFWAVHMQGLECCLKEIGTDFHAATSRRTATASPPADISVSAA